MKLRRHILLVIAGIALAAAATLNVFFNQKANKSTHLSIIEQNLIREINVIDNMLLSIRNKLEAKPTQLFTALLSQSYPYPVYIFEKGNLIYWSDHRYAVSYQEHFSGYYSERCFANRNGIFFAKKNYLLLDSRDIEIVAIIPLLERLEINEGNLRTVLNPTIFPVSKSNHEIEIFLNSSIGDKITGKFGLELFSVQFPKNYNYFPEGQLLVMLLAIFGFSLVIVVLKRWIRVSIRVGKSIQMFFLVIFLLVGLRFTMIFFQIPYVLNDSELFAPYPSAPFFAPSVGDWLLNMVALLIIIAFLGAHFKKIVPIAFLYRLPSFYKQLLVFLLLLLTYSLLVTVTSIATQIQTMANIEIDINQSLQISQIKVVALLIFVLMVVVYFFVCHWIMRLFTKLTHSSLEASILFLIASLSYFSIMQEQYWAEFNANAVYIGVSTFFGLPARLRKTGYRALVYMLGCTVCCATVGAMMIAKIAAKYDLEKKDNFITQLVGNDPYLESLLQQTMQRIRQDDLIISAFTRQNFVGIEWLENKIRKEYLDRQLSHFKINILFFNEKGIAQPSGITLKEFLYPYDKPEHQTLYPDVWFINEPAEGMKQYVCWAHFKNGENLLGHIVLHLSKRRTIQNTLQPTLLISGFDARTDIKMDKNFSFAIYEQGNLIHSEGEYNYTKDFITEFARHPNFFRKEISTDEYHHLIVHNGRGRYIVVTSLRYPLAQWLSNFSFLFLLLAFLMITSMSLYNFFLRKNKKKFTFATKIQLYLNLAFFVPLLVVSALIVSVLNNSNIEETKKYYLEKAQSVSSSLSEKLIATQRQKGEVRAASLEKELSEIARITQADLHIFNKSGKLWLTSHPQTFENELVASFVNPLAVAGIIEQKLSKMMLEEKIGNLNYRAAYVSIKSPMSNEVIGILGIPFFQSKYEQDKQIIAVLTTIIKIFALVFIILLLLSYFSAKSLVKPLILVTQRIRQTTLSEHNEPIHYHSQDEFGILIGEYNRMIEKLEESKIALARSEKETAWREMAKQVAHEIKNPLTPMKLTLQHLERIVDKSNENIKRYIKTLLTQIDTLSDIAASFAAFAKMPSFKEEEFDMAKVLHETVSLYLSDENLVVEKDFEEGSFPVIGDAKLMGRIFTNLIINGIQSVEEGVVPRIVVSLRKEPNNKLIIEFKDNGRGIPKPLQPKIFIPNFTTKTTGTGIGLAIAKRGIEHYGGRIWFETQENVGTSFFIEMPLVSKPIPKENLSVT